MKVFLNILGEAYASTCSCLERAAMLSQWDSHSNWVFTTRSVAKFLACRNGISMSKAFLNLYGSVHILQGKDKSEDVTQTLWGTARDKELLNCHEKLVK